MAKKQATNQGKRSLEDILKLQEGVPDGFELSEKGVFFESTFGPTQDQTGKRQRSIEPIRVRLSCPIAVTAWVMDERNKHFEGHVIFVNAIEQVVEKSFPLGDLLLTPRRFARRFLQWGFPVSPGKEGEFQKFLAGFRPAQKGTASTILQGEVLDAARRLRAFLVANQERFGTLGHPPTSEQIGSRDRAGRLLLTRKVLDEQCGPALVNQVLQLLDANGHLFQNDPGHINAKVPLPGKKRGRRYALEETFFTDPRFAE
jgi:hypothetical protein